MVWAILAITLDPPGGVRIVARVTREVSIAAAERATLALRFWLAYVMRWFREAPLRQLSLLIAVFSLGLWLPASPPEVPARVVFAPGQGWVNAAFVAGLPAGAPDGAILRFAWEEEDRSATRLAVQLGPESNEVASGRVALGGKLSINKASAQGLEGLPGVGPALAGRIVAGRPYRSVDDLDRVKGIGKKTLEKLRPLVEL